MLIVDEQEMLVTVAQHGAGLDGGDQASNEWWFWFWYQLMAVNKLYQLIDRTILLQVIRKISFHDVVLQLEPNEDGHFRRSWKAPWNDSSNPTWVFTRDQTIGLVICSGFNRPLFWRVTLAHLKRLGFTQSGEPYHLFIFTWLRSLSSQYEFLEVPVLLLLPIFDIPIWGLVLERCGYIPHFDQDTFDAFKEYANHSQLHIRLILYLSALINFYRFFNKIGPDDVGDDKNLIMCLYQLGPETFVRKSARQFYFKNRVESYGNALTTLGNVNGAVKWYFRGPNPDGSNGNPDLGNFGIEIMTAQEKQWAKL